MSDTWRLNGPFWRIPIRVCSDNNNGSLVTLDAISLLNCQVDVAQDTLIAAGANGRLSPECTAEYEIPTDLLSIVATKLKPCDPETVLVWNPGDSLDNAAGEDMNAFVKAYILAGAPFEEHMAIGLWHGLCKYALHSLINLGRPVPMGFCTLHPTMFRANWKDAIFTKMPQDEPDTTKPSEDPSVMLKRVQGQIVSGELLLPEQIKKKSETPAEWIAMQSIEVERHEPFLRQSREVESAKLRQYGKINYWKHVLANLKSSVPIALKSMATFIREAAAPSFRLPAEHSNGSTSEDQDKWLSTGNHGGAVGKRNQSSDRYSFIQGIATDRAEKIAELLEMPDQDKPVELWRG